uniref:G_PROTEIN_RECEP_F1_2 domain-containing protein n=1 Tax=Panagrellus redivivus TaxID=6233 RepID=A0A7E4VXU2_PANRE
MLLYQTILPCFSASLIVVIVMLAITMKNYDGGLYIILMFPFPLISFINPIITILCVKRYRQVTASVLTGKPVLASISMDRRSTWVSTINDGAVPSFQGVHETHVVT